MPRPGRSAVGVAAVCRLQRRALLFLVSSPCPSDPLAWLFFCWFECACVVLVDASWEKGAKARDECQVLLLPRFLFSFLIATAAPRTQRSARTASRLKIAGHSLSLRYSAFNGLLLTLLSDGPPLHS